MHPAAPQFTFLPNPALLPEVGRNKEFGVNLRYDNVLRPNDAFRAKFNVFQNDIDNYINLKFLGPTQGVGGQRCLNFVVFFCEQYQNIPSARIEGLDGCRVHRDALRRRHRHSRSGGRHSGDRLVVGRP